MIVASLATIKRIAPECGYPRDTTTLISRLRREGAEIVGAAPVRGGRTHLYALSTLPAKLRDHPELRGLLEPSKAVVSFEVYLHAVPSQRAEADRRRAMCCHVAERIGAGETKQDAYASAAANFAVSVSTVRNAWRCVRDVDPADWLSALVKAYRGRAPKEVSPDVLRYFFSDYGRVEAPQLQAVYERTVKAAKLNGWGEVPSAKTLKRRFDALPAAVRTRLRKGDRAADEMYPHQERDRSGVRPLDSFNMDSRTWDIRVELDDGRIIRPVITLAQDEASNFILGYEVTETESSHSYRRVIRGFCEGIGIPLKARFDNTRAAANKALTGGAKNRFRFTDRTDDLEGILPRIGCAVSFTKPYNGRSKLCERAFAELKERTEKHPTLAGCYTGRSTSHKPANYGDHAVPLAVFREILRQGVEHYNSRTDRRSQVANGRSHQAVFEEGLQTVKVRKLTPTQLRYFFAVAERRRVSPAGTISLGKRPHVNRYFHPALQDHAGVDVVAWYDPDNLATPLMVEAIDGRMIADEVELIEAGGFASIDAARQYERGKRRQRRGEKEYIAGLDMMTAAECARALEPVAPLATPETPIITPAKGFRQPKPNRAPPHADAEISDLLLKGARNEQRDRESGRMAG